jgi:hypothetical protein
MSDPARSVRIEAGRALGQLGQLAQPALVAAAGCRRRLVREALSWATQTLADPVRHALQERGVEASRIFTLRLPVSRAGDFSFPGTLRLDLEATHWPAAPPGTVAGTVFTIRNGRTALTRTPDGPTLVIDQSSGLACAVGDHLELAWRLPPDAGAMPLRCIAPSPQAAQLNQVLEAAWKALQMPVVPCSLCGVRMPRDEVAPSGLPERLAHVMLQPAARSAVISAYQLAAAYLGVKPQHGDNALVFLLLFWKDLKHRHCERCGSYTCQRCARERHVAVGCVACAGDAPE